MRTQFLGIRRCVSGLIPDPRRDISLDTQLGAGAGVSELVMTAQYLRIFHATDKIIINSESLASRNLAAVRYMAFNAFPSSKEAALKVGMNGDKSPKDRKSKEPG